MKIKVFEYSTGYWSWGWRVADSEIEGTVNQWMAANPAAQIRLVKHESVMTH
jgi:hypothetical protein